MTVVVEINLPGSSLDELKKIIMAYRHYPDKALAEDVGKLAGVHRTTISRNSKFLVDVGILSNGAQKACTDLGRNLARAIEHDVKEDQESFWKEAVRNNEKMSHLVTTLRIKGGMTEKAFSDHILYVSGATSNGPNKTGARTIVDVLLSAGMIAEADGKINVATTAVESAVPNTSMSNSQESKTLKETPRETETVGIPSHGGVKNSIINANPSPQVTINIQLQIPEATDPETYERLFRALASNLFPPKTDGT